MCTMFVGIKIKISLDIFLFNGKSNNICTGCIKKNVTPVLCCILAVREGSPVRFAYCNMSE